MVTNIRKVDPHVSREGQRTIPMVVAMRWIGDKDTIWFVGEHEDGSEAYITEFKGVRSIYIKGKWIPFLTEQQ